ncbi:3-hydroxyanthranilate 3,4-dioxygenase [Amycolatopsis balhimycina DSM 5908]|uniref:3-hydroxyanthranilate 3,4-dioxygenase n=2 Tax=Amycolatopsis balhimycina TaxID=208443 RepID=A0A428WJG2_AMYBA|nr:3-hydroxyanthranilate 3,4-dioxygenase [Amycolatopsis balhimycina DSM 5908]
MRPLESFSLQAWLDLNRTNMLLPITNQTIYKGNDTFIVMAVGGPNNRKDFHYNESEELFIQLSGDIEVGLYIDGKITIQEVKEGEMFLVPARQPHQPRRPANTMGIVIEKHRVPTERDGFLYFCNACNAKLFEQYFVLEDIIKQLPLVQRAFYNSLENRTCSACRHVTEQPEGWSDEVALLEEDNPYSEDPLTAIRGRSW